MINNKDLCLPDCTEVLPEEIIPVYEQKKKLRNISEINSCFSLIKASFVWFVVVCLFVCFKWVCNYQCRKHFTYNNIWDFYVYSYMYCMYVAYVLYICIQNPYGKDTFSNK